jgi:hypothetical protein
MRRFFTRLSSFFEKKLSSFFVVIFCLVSIPITWRFPSKNSNIATADHVIDCSVGFLLRVGRRQLADQRQSYFARRLSWPG